MNLHLLLLAPTKVLLTFTFFSILLGTTLAHGEIYNVASGQSVQAAIDGSSSGDEIIIYQGTYAEDLTSNGKGLTIRGKEGEQVEIDSISFQNPAHAMTLSNLRIMGDINASKENLSIQESTIWGNLHYDSDGQVKRSVKLHNSMVDGNLSANKVNLTIKKSTINGNLTAPFRTDDASNELSAIILQSTIGQKLTCRSRQFLGSIQRSPSFILRRNCPNRGQPLQRELS